MAAVLAACLGGCAREPSWPPDKTLVGSISYFDSRKIVVLAVYRGSGSVPDSVVVLDDAGNPSAADSLRRITETNPLPGPTPHARPTLILRNYPLDPQAYSIPRRDQLVLPSFARGRLMESPFQEWIEALKTHDPTLGLDSFVAVWLESFHAVEGLGLLYEEFMADKWRAGVLSASPDSHVVLDPFMGAEFDDSLRVGYDVDSGYQLFDGRTGDRIGYRVTTDMSFDLGGWVDDRHFVLAGTGRFEAAHQTMPGEWIYAAGPVLVIGDVDRRVLVAYAGPPWGAESPANDLLKVQSRAYPKVNWDPY